MGKQVRSLVQRELETPTIWGSLLVGVITTLISLAVVDGIFSLAIHESFSILDSRSVPHFKSPSHFLNFDVINFLVAVTAVGTRKWILPLLGGLFGCAVILPMYATTGSITEFMPLEHVISLHMELLAVAVVLNVILAAIWIRESKGIRASGKSIQQLAPTTGP